MRLAGASVAAPRDQPAGVDRQVLLRPDMDLPDPTSAAASDENPGPTLASVLQEIGLKLEPKKRQIAVLVVESAEKTPVEN